MSPRLAIAVKIGMMPQYRLGGWPVELVKGTFRVLPIKGGAKVILDILDGAEIGTDLTRDQARDLRDDLIEVISGGRWRGMQDLELEAESFTTQLSADGTEVRVAFQRGGDEVSAILRRDRIPQLAAALLERSGQGTVRPIGSAVGQLGATFRWGATQFAPLPNGGVRLTLHLEVADGVRTLPMDLSRDDVADLIDDLQKHVESIPDDPANDEAD